MGQDTGDFVDNFPEVADLEVLELRKKVKELEQKLSQYERQLKEAGLLERTSKVSDEEQICIDQIAQLRELSDKKVPFQTEDVKNLEVLVKTLQMARGKAPVEEKKAKKKEDKPDIGKLLKIIEGNE